jgi:hypothetical protein
LAIPEDEDSVSASGVPEFIEFIVKDIPDHQLPMRGGLMWLNRESSKRFGANFTETSKDYQLKIIEEIAYPQDRKKKITRSCIFLKYKEPCSNRVFY